MPLYNYQETFNNNLAIALTRNRKVVAQLATGGGKTVCFSANTHSYLERNPGKSVLINVHREELLKQTRRTLFNMYGINSQPIVAGMRYIPAAPVYVAMVESVNKRIAQLRNIGLVINDECHIANFNKLLPAFPDQLIVGYTATPLTADKKNPLKNFYDDIVCGIDTPELIQRGALCQNLTFCPEDIVERGKLKKKGADFDQILMAEIFSKQRHIKNTVRYYEKYALGDKTIVFNVNVDHSKLVTAAFIGAGYKCMHLDGETPHTQRMHILNWFKHTPDAILCNVGVATTGFDEPSIKTVIINKSTLSMPHWLQMTGRGGRIFDLKDLFHIIDLGGNGVAHGDWNDPRDWADLFWNPQRPKKSKDSVAPKKLCPGCQALIPVQCKVCSFCGYEFISKLPEEAELKELTAITKGVDVAALTQKHADKKEYFVFYEMGKKIVANATKNKLSFDVALAAYIDKTKEWCTARGKKFNSDHEKKCREHLIILMTPAASINPDYFHSLDAHFKNMF